MMMWNADRLGAAPLVSDSGVPGACRRFATAHAERLRATLRAPMIAHLQALASHNLLRREDLLDCMVIVDSSGSHSNRGKAKGARQDACPARTRHGQPRDALGKPLVRPDMES